MPTQREWTILLYMAGDNGKTFQTKQGNYSLMAEMTGAGYKDIAEVEQIGTTDQVAVLAQFDTLPAKDTEGANLGTQEGGTYRLEIHKDRLVKENIVEIIPEVNTGDPAELSKFIVWGMNRCPAKRTMLVLWNHGMGWKDDDIYETLQRKRSVKRKPNRIPSKPMFRSTAVAIDEKVNRARSDEKRAILADDTSMDFLTNVEMSQALRVAEFAQDEVEAAAIFKDADRLKEIMTRGTEGSLRHLSIIGMDACLMAMIEVQYQVRKFADVMVASQEVEPMHGWPYTEILEKLNLRPTMDASELGALIVEQFAESYVATKRTPPSVTQSAINLSKLGDAGLLIRSFSRALAKDFDDVYLKEVYRDAKEYAADQGYAFEDPEYIDLISFLRAMLTGYKGTGAQPRTLAAAQKLLDWLVSDQSPIIKSLVTGKFENKAHGISIYVPTGTRSPLYADLDFKSTGWPRTLETISKPQR